MFDFIYVPLGMLLHWLYNLTSNFGWAVIIFTVLVRIVLLPLMVKQQKSMANMQKIQPKLNEIQKKYQNDKNKLNEEMMKLYKEHDVNPMGGCLPLIIQMPILIAVYGVIQNPITYILNLKPPVEVLTALCQKPTDTQLAVLAFVKNHFNEALQKLSEIGEIGQNFDLNSLLVNFNFLGIDLGLTPQAEPGNYILWLIPVLGAATTWLSSKFMGNQNQSGQSEQQASQMQMMQVIFPLMTGYFCYILPAAMGLYWIVGNLLQIGQTYLLNNILLKKAAAEPLVIEQPKARKAQKAKKRK
jgi:YidC/Oxa1 family membrane protein insertase